MPQQATEVGRVKQRLPIWRVLELYNEDPKPEVFIAEMWLRGMLITPPAEKLLRISHLAVGLHISTVGLVKVTPHLLGFRVRPSFREIYDRALSPDFSLFPCHDQIGPRLRYEYQEQSVEGRPLHVAMSGHVIEHAQYNLLVRFLLTNDEGRLSLDVAAYSTGSEKSYKHQLYDEFVFATTVR